MLLISAAPVQPALPGGEPLEGIDSHCGDLGCKWRKSMNFKDIPQAIAREAAGGVEQCADQPSLQGPEYLPMSSSHHRIYGLVPIAIPLPALLKNDAEYCLGAGGRA